MNKFRLILMLSALSLVVMWQPSFGQNDTAPKNSLKKEQLKDIEFSEIPIRSVEVINQTRQAFHDLIPANTIAKLKEKNIRLLASIDTNLLKPIKLDDPAINFRYLENRRLILLQEQEKITNEKARLTEVISSLDQLSEWLSKHASLWKETRKQLLRDSLTRQVPVKVNNTIAFLDSANNLVATKTNAMMDILEKTIAIGINIDLYLEKTVALIKVKQQQSFSSDHTPFFSLDLTSGYMNAITSSFRVLVDVKIKELADYMKNFAGPFAGMLILFSAIFAFFMLLRRKIQVNMNGYGKFYKEMMLIILLRPFNAAIIMIIILSIILFPGRPIIVREFTAYLIAYPLLNLVNTILHKKFRIYLYVFSVVVVLYMFVLLISSETILYRVFLFLIALAEILLLGMLLYRLRKKPAFPGNVNTMIIFFGILHLGLAVAGLISNIYGRVLMTEMVLNAVFSNILNGVILFISVIIVNGLVAAGIDSPQGRSFHSLNMHGEILKQRIITALNAIAIFSWIFLMLKAFRINDYVFNLIASIFSHKFAIGSASFSLDLVVIFFVVIYISLLIAKLLRIILEEDVLSRLPLSKGLPHTIAMGVKYSMIVAGFLLAVNAAGIPVDKITIILGAFSVGIGFGLQNIFSNMVSGLILLFERPIQIGDTVQVGQLTGNVKSIDLRSSNVQTFDGAEVIVPNGQLVTNEVINWTLSDKKRRLEIPVGVAYESDPPFVHTLLMQILQEHAEVLDDPEPMVFFSGLGESSLDFVLLFWIGDYSEGRRIKSEILFRVFALLKENHISIPFPQRDIHVKFDNNEVQDINKTSMQNKD